MFFQHQKQYNRKSNRPIVLKLIPRESPAYATSFCIWEHFHHEHVDSTTVTSLPTPSKSAVVLPRGVIGNNELVPVVQEVADISSPRFLDSGRCWQAR
jgi:hypothetical protein